MVPVMQAERKENRMTQALATPGPVPQAFRPVRSVARWLRGVVGARPGSRRPAQGDTGALNGYLRDEIGLPPLPERARVPPYLHHL